MSLDFHQLGMCIDIVEIWFGIANMQICQVLTELSACDTSVFLFRDNNLSKYQWIFTRVGLMFDWIGCALML